MDYFDTDMTEASSSSSSTKQQTPHFTTTTSSNTQQPQSPISDLLTHPAVAFANKTRLSDPAQTALLRTVNIYDFDQTLFRSPLLNPALWDPAFLGLLLSWNGVGAGWWHHAASLDALGEEAEATAWEGWWNEELVDHIRQSAANPACLTVLLTGRFGPVHNKQILKMIQAKGLVFDLVASKPTTVALLENYHLHHNQHHLKHNRHQQQHHPRHYQHHQHNNNTTDQHQRRQDSFNNHRRGINAENAEKAETSGALIYRKIHTYNTKLDFIYHILFEYPQLQHMRLWDDRLEQISRFRRVGQSWLSPTVSNGQQIPPRLQTFDITFVMLAPKYLDLDLEQDLVEMMIKEHNTLVRMEQRGAPSWVSGLGPVPKTRPELERIFSGRGSRHNPGEYDFWGPMETYSPPLRTKIELVDLVQTTGVSFAPGVQRFLKGLVPMDVFIPRAQERGGFASTATMTASNTIKVNRPSGLVNKDLTSWTIPEEMDVPLCLGAAPAAFLKTLGGLGAMVLIELVAVGEYDARVWALQIKDASPYRSATDMSLPTSPAPATAIHAGRYFATHELSQPPATLDLIDEDEGDEPVTVVGPTGAIFSSIRAFMAGSPPVRGRVMLRKDDLGTTPYLTLAHMSRGSKPSKASKIKQWEPLQLSKEADQPPLSLPGQRIVIVGTIAEKRLRGTKAQNFGHLATIARPEVPISQIVKDFMAQQQQPLTGPELGAVIRTVQQAMERLKIPNKADRIEQITALTRSIVYRDLVASRNEAMSA
ncbi:hypothetical protein BGZ83_004445 [Gryganskiella cystojenkinii]|nr:hypothetical protein BGZ83_004445 [Gryganskiella cystojenkinii]